MNVAGRGDLGLRRINNNGSPLTTTLRILDLLERPPRTISPGDAVMTDPPEDTRSRPISVLLLPCDTLLSGGTLMLTVGSDIF